MKEVETRGTAKDQRTEQSHRERDGNEERKKGGGWSGAVMNEEKRKLEQRGRQQAAPGRLLLLEAGQGGTDFSSGEL